MPPESEEKLATILRQKISELAALDRYERRALSRRKAAIRNFDAAQTLAVSAKSLTNVRGAFSSSDLKNAMWPSFTRERPLSPRRPTGNNFARKALTALLPTNSSANDGHSGPNYSHSMRSSKCWDQTLSAAANLNICSLSPALPNQSGALLRLA